LLAGAIDEAAGGKPLDAPSTRTFALADLGVSIRLPADWGTGEAGRGVRFAAFEPGYRAAFQLIAGPTSLSLTGQTAHFLELERKRLPTHGVSISRQATRLGTTRAVLFTLRWRGPTAGGRSAVIDEFVYLVEHGGSIFVLEYVTTDPWVAKERPSFAASAASIRFDYVT
jgi:hypothetical protein